MDKQTKTEIKVVVRDAIREVMECYEERWLTDREMSQYVSVMTQRWLREHGEMLPRTPICWKDTVRSRSVLSAPVLTGRKQNVVRYLISHSW